MKDIQPLAHRGGFTLIELMIAIAIMAMMASFIGSKVINKLQEAKVSATKIQIRQLEAVLDDYRRVCGFYPTTEQGLEALVKAPTTGRLCKNYDPEGFIKKVPKDGWDHEFIYISDGNKKLIKSLGANGEEGGTGVDQDISSDDLD